MSRIEDIKARVAAATPGPWVADEEWWVCQPGEDGDIIVDGSVFPDPRDAAFIAHARTDIPDLLRVVEAAADLAGRYPAMAWTDLRAALADLDR